jgi:hypothetical protein
MNIIVRKHLIHLLLTLIQLILFTHNLPVSLVVAKDAQPHQRPVLFTTDEMLAEAKERIMCQEEPFYTAWIKVKSQADAALNRHFTPYLGSTYQKYFDTGLEHSFAARDTALGWALTGDVAYAEKARQIMLDWARSAQINTDPANSEPQGQGLVIGRVMTVFCYTYSLLYPYLNAEDVQELRTWFSQSAMLILKGRKAWIDSNYYNTPGSANNHLAAHMMGLTAIGYALNDQEIIRYAIDSPDNPRDAKDMIELAILMPGDTVIKGAPQFHPGEIYDRYRIYENKGLTYALLNLRFLTAIAEMTERNHDLNLYEFVGTRGETLEISYDFYADFFITLDTAIKGGYYSAEPVNKTDLALYELAHRNYPDNSKFKQLLEMRYRVAYENQIFGYSLVLTHGLSDIKSVAQEPSLGITQWRFNQPGDFLGWKMRKSIKGAADNECLRLTITGSDPSIISPPNLRLMATQYRWIKIRMRNNTADTEATVFFITDTDRKWDDRKLLLYSIKPYSDFKEYIIPVIDILPRLKS